MPEFILHDTGPVKLMPATPDRNDTILPSGEISKFENADTKAEFREIKFPFFSIGYRILSFFRKLKWSLREDNRQLRLEAVLTGKINAHNENGEQVLLRSGDYHITNHSSITSVEEDNNACNYFVTQYSERLLEAMDVKDLMHVTGVLTLTTEMIQIIQAMLHNPYNEKVRTLHYDNCVRELVKLHLANPNQKIPGELTDEDIAAIRAADAIMREDLTQHLHAPIIAQRVGINQNKLKRGFKEVFQMGLSKRLTFHRLNEAKLLLETTRLKVTVIAMQVGFANRGSFITSFKTRFGNTPEEWRKKRH